MSNGGRMYSTEDESFFAAVANSAHGRHLCAAQTVGNSAFAVDTNLDFVGYDSESV